MPAALMFALVLALAALGGAQHASAAFPGTNGKIAFTSDRDGNGEIYSMNADGSGATRLTNNVALDSDPAWSPDGTKIAFGSYRTGGSDIYVMNANGSGVTQLTSDPALDSEPAWSSDGTKIAFVSDRDGNQEIYSMNADGTGVTRLTNDPAFDDAPAWSPDGTTIAFMSSRTSGHMQIFSMHADGTVVTRLTTTSESDLVPTWSPDGSKIAYMFDGNGYDEIYSMDANGSNNTQLTTLGSFIFDDQPAWSPDGAKIAFDSNRDTSTFEIYSMNANGSGVTRLTNNTAGDFQPDWQPAVPVALTAQFLQPLDQSSDPLNPVLNTGKNGRVIPVRVRLSLGDTAITDLNAPGPVTIVVSKLASCSSTAGTDPVEQYADAGQSSAGTNLFRYDTGAQVWTYNLDTKALGLVTGNCYRIDVRVNGTLVANAFAVFEPTK
jgi:Tol biopolymer transport system component